MHHTHRMYVQHLFHISADFKLLQMEIALKFDGKPKTFLTDLHIFHFPVASDAYFRFRFRCRAAIQVSDLCLFCRDRWFYHIPG